MLVSRSFAITVHTYVCDRIWGNQLVKLEIALLPFTLSEDAAVQI